MWYWICIAERIAHLFASSMVDPRDARALPAIGSFSLAKPIIHQRVAEPHGALGLCQHHFEWREFLMVIKNSDDKIQV